MAAKHLLALTVVAALVPVRQQYPGWIMDNPRSAFDQAKRTGKPLFVVFR
jgi:hypothetical protein